MSLCSLLAVPLAMAALVSAVVGLAVCLHDLLRRRVHLPSLHYRDSTLSARVLTKCGLRQRVFSPPFWLRSGHAQTLAASLLPRGDGSAELCFEREYLQMRDKGVVALDWLTGSAPKTRRKGTVLIVLPPVTGDAMTVASLCHLATRRGFKAVVFNRRGHGGSVLTTPRMQSSGDPTDLRQVVKYLRLRFPRNKLAAVAYGTGCGLLISYLGEFGSSAILSAGACVSPCYDTSERFSGPLKSVYDLVYLLKLKAILCSHAKALHGVVNVTQALQAWDFTTYEERVYCRMYTPAPGCTSTAPGVTPCATHCSSAVANTMEDYWERNNPIRDVDDIAVPVLCINSLDDPFYAGASIPYDLFNCCPNFLLVVTEKGGHCGFLEGFPLRSWADRLCLDYLEAVMEITTKGYSSTCSNGTRCHARSTI
ncbi:hypothetical protein C0Q70_06665 [Pomacea canaliculata]|uniref:Serine aminopeptidase S33 domain-containing protein n=1 Tax=Pomacea canaliculata TaxID=400727 RepID=A0A2T7PCV1_POMCA|nr:protein ABHD15-like [Pomacea canaliculata]XP_025089069.1 protein ABHD15-like [Pomacea canaliculata]XP_025089070.1 protein ABHD15-like [Pomacea canaliculata]XP_025089071.1 protein ABHD15-like [Pomacea canaliculata]XP_025089072.1 protein ABHD15-like [Pomacea canaliculata]PVD31253.1 hypothetical protein C0Q70_06665 [Pomacea canaliculata]